MDDQLVAVLEPELRRIAAARLRRESGCSLSTHELINEAMLKIMRNPGMEIYGREHMLALSSRIMRQVLVDHARHKKAQKRAYDPVTLRTDIAEEEPVELLELNDVLTSLADLDPNRAALVEMRFFGGMTIDDIAKATDQSSATVKRRWASTRAWLYERLSV